jgi:CarD family transcriptional regulator
MWITSCAGGVEMHKVGERVLYGSNGVMEIVDVREETIADVTRKYYVMCEVGSVVKTMTFVPVDNKNLVAAMRPLLTKDEIMQLLSRVKSLPDVEWQNDNRIRSEKFRRIIESGDREGMISLIKTIYENGKRRESEGKKNYLADENFMRKAERLICAEFSAVLGIPESEVPEFIAQNI